VTTARSARRATSCACRPADSALAGFAEYPGTLPDGESGATARHRCIRPRALLSRVNPSHSALQALWQLAMSRGKTDCEKMVLRRLALDVALDVVMVNEYRGRLTARTG
jgi:hypothetical protein